MVPELLHKLPTLAILFFAGTAKSVVHFSRLWQFPQELCDCWHIAAVTAQYANEFEAES
jgi:hypothetical protein